MSRHPSILGLRRCCVHASLALSAIIGCKSERASPEDLLRARSLGLGYLERNRLPEAEQQFKLIVAGAPKDPFGYANLGLTYLQAGRLAEAEQQVRRARDLDPASADVGRMLAKVYALTNRRTEARTTLEQFARTQPRDAKVLYALAKLDSADDQSGQKAEQRLRQVLDVAPANLAVRLDLLNTFLRRGEADSAVRQLEEIRRLRPEPPREAAPLLATAIDLLRAGKVAEAMPAIERFTRIMQLTTPYQVALADVKWYDDPLVGRPVLTFEPQSLIKLRSSGVLPDEDTLRFVDATSDAGLPYAGVTVTDADSSARPPGSASMLATGDFNGDGADEVLASYWSGADRKLVTRLFLVERYRSLDVTQKTSLTIPAGAVGAAVGDFDNDGWLDLFVIGSDARGYLLHNAAGTRFEDVTAKSGTSDVRGARRTLFVDLDHDGDLDLLLVGGPRNLVYRNNLDGTFTEVAESMGLSGRAATNDAAFADLDDDGHIDLVAATDAGVVLYHNTGQRRFEDATAASGLPATGATGAWTGVTVGDYDNDGAFDVLLTRRDGPPELWRNDGNGRFGRDSRSSLGALAALVSPRAEFVDVDNDGWLDLAAFGTPKSGQRADVLLHNDGTGRFVDRSAALPAIRSAESLVPIDVDNDGDMDVLVGDTRGIRLLANEGSVSRLGVQVALVGLRTGSGKNNTFGIGAKLDLRSGQTHQTRVVTGRTTHFGLGQHLKADVLRVQWPNGVPQTVYFPGTDQDVLELELLKGSCAFLYAWDGKGFRFVTDVMWRSALGMPIGLMAADDDGGTMYAPAGASREYLRIPGAALQPRRGRYVLQLTEELWETAYTDEMKLLTVDHPDSVEVFVDERFVPPGPVTLRLYHAVRRRPPLSAIDDRGNDVLAALRHHDDVYVSNLTPLRYQGLVEPHDLTLDLGPDAGQPGSLLVLRGWIYPTDASINVAVSQQSVIRPMPPAIEVRGANGQWTPAIDMSFPSGKDKTIVLDLAGKFPTSDHRVRIRTNMQIYWDQAIVAFDAQSSPVKVDSLTPLSADLHYRGFSRTYRKGGRYGPHWFDYGTVTKESPWRVIAGAFTRFGDVRPLLEQSDDMYVIMAPGDEATIQFDASSATALPKGWTRDFLLYTDGWIKDADLNTAFGNTVAPLPFHGMKEYPYAPGESYPTDPQHQRFVNEYNTRVLKRH